jgi:hypothetical protein
MKAIYGKEDFRQPLLHKLPFTPICRTPGYFIAIREEVPS